MTKTEATAKLVEINELLKLMLSHGFNPKNIPTYRSVLKDFETIDELYPSEKGKECIDIVKQLIALYPDEVGLET